jgi:maltose alpha-D-glucosyltransferase / alpha-amylase
MKMSDIWYRHAIIYSLDVETFYDSDGDGIGDFQGLTSKLDYIASLGINCLWLLPFYPSPNRDNGYDVMDYYSIDPRLGTLGDFADFMGEAERRGIKVIIDIVVNHTSINHPWFQEARKDKKSRYYNYYVWSKEMPVNIKIEPAFPGEEPNVWTYDDVAGEFYLHRFYKEQPDLNVANQEVKTEIRKIIRFWLRLGVAGVRLDAATLLIEQDAPAHHETEDNFDILNEFYDYTGGFRDIVLLGEANDKIEELSKYFGKGDRLNMLFNFIGNQNMFLSLATKRSEPMEAGLKSLPEIPTNAEWLNFARHHDELTLDKLSESDRKKIFECFGPEKEMQIYNRGIRRRLAPMMNNDRKRIEQVYSLLFSTPGIPLLRYGDEIGMGDDLSLKGRESVRTVMQWKNGPNGGFSTCGKEKLIKPTIEKGEYGYEKVNVEDQSEDQNSIFNWVKKLINVRNSCPEIGTRKTNIIMSQNPNILAFKYHTPYCNLYIYHNLLERELSFDCEIDDREVRVIFSDSNYDVKKGKSEISLNAFGYLWMRVYK